MKNGAASPQQQTQLPAQPQPGVPADFDWMEAFNVAAAQRDESTRNLQNFQIQTALEKKKLSDRIVELETEIESLRTSH